MLSFLDFLSSKKSENIIPGFATVCKKKSKCVKLSKKCLTGEKISLQTGGTGQIFFITSSPNH